MIQKPGLCKVTEPDEVETKQVAPHFLEALRTFLVPSTLTFAHSGRKVSRRSWGRIVAAVWKTVRGRSITVAGHGSSKAVATASSSVMLVLTKRTPRSRTSWVGGRRSRIRNEAGSSPRARRCETIQPPTRPVRMKGISWGDIHLVVRSL